MSPSKINYGYPVLLTNNHTDTVTVGYGVILPLEMEAKDSTGLWKPIEKRFIYACGMGLNSIILPPNEIILTSAPIYKGDFKTDLRLVLGDNFSPVFQGNINYSQFEKER